jgi:hypothetical protein
VTNITESEEEDSNSKRKKRDVNQESDGSNGSGDEEKISQDPHSCNDLVSNQLMEEVGEEKLKDTTSNGSKECAMVKVPLFVKLCGKKLVNGGEKETKKNYKHLQFYPKRKCELGMGKTYTQFDRKWSEVKNKLY